MRRAVCIYIHFVRRPFRAAPSSGVLPRSATQSHTRPGGADSDSGAHKSDVWCGTRHQQSSMNCFLLENYFLCSEPSSPPNVVVMAPCCCPLFLLSRHPSSPRAVVLPPCVPELALPSLAPPQARDHHVWLVVASIYLQGKWLPPFQGCSTHHCPRRRGEGVYSMEFLGHDF